MSKGLKMMLFWSLGFPVIVTALRIITDFLLGKEVELSSYLPVFLGIAAAGFIFVGPFHYYIAKSQGK